MLDAQYLRLIRNAATVALSTLVVSGCLFQEDVKEDEVSADAIIEKDFQLSGSVGDGPVVGAAMRVFQNDGTILHEFRSDASAAYNIVIRTKGMHYPLIIDARGGTDLVTNHAPDFVLLGAALEPSENNVVNLNPFSTLALEIARDLPGEDPIANIYAAQEIVAGSMNFGLVSMSATDPMMAPINGGNVAEIVKSSEGLGEVVRRTRNWLLKGGFVWNGDDVVRAIGSDLIDGVIDGAGGPQSDARLAAIANIVIAQVLLESSGNELHVDETDATENLEMAIETMNLGTVSPSLGELTATDPMLRQINTGLEAADAISFDTRVTGLRNSASGLQAGLQPQLARDILPSDYRETLDAVILLLIGGDWDAIHTVNEVVRNRAGAPDDDSPPNDPPPDDPPSGNTPPSIYGSPANLVTVDTRYDFVPEALDEDDDPLTFSFTGLPAWVTTADTSTGHIRGTPGAGDIGTHSGIVITVSDGQANADLGPFSVMVEAVGTYSATLSWQPPTQNEDDSPLTDLAGYTIYRSRTPGSGSYPRSETVYNPGLTTYVVEGLAPGLYEFAVTAINSAGIESQLSETATTTISE